MLEGYGRMKYCECKQNWDLSIFIAIGKNAIIFVVFWLSKADMT